MTLYLIRHAAAGDRSRWNGDDLERPLDDTGRRQAEAIARHLAASPIRAVRSSVAVRCVDTVAPLAADLGVEVDICRELTEGAPPSSLVELLGREAAAGGDVALCSHGDLIPEALNHLLRDGMAVVGDRGCRKGSIWSLETDDDRIVRGAYLAVP